MTDGGPWYTLSLNVKPTRVIAPGEIDALELVKAIAAVFPDGEVLAESVNLQLVPGQFIFPNLAPAVKVNRTALSVKVNKEDQE